MSDRLISTTNWSHRLRHLAYSGDMVAEGVGHRGRPVCSKTGIDTVYDQVWFDEEFPSYGGNPNVVIADLPLCKRCEKFAARAVSA